MKRLTPSGAAARMASIENARERAVQQLASRVWRDIVVPTCRKHGLDFRAGMGVHSVSFRGVDLYDAEDAARKGLKLKRLFAALNITIGPGSPRFGPQPLGSWMDDFITSEGAT